MGSPSAALEYKTAPLQAILATEQLQHRPARRTDHAAVNRALVDLAQTMANSPERTLQRLVEVALELCQAHSAGLSLLEQENGHDIFRWHGVAGRFAPHLWGTTPREFSPCGTVLDTDKMQLMYRPDRHFGYFAEVEPRIEEALLVPFYIDGKAVGTVWVIAHDSSRRFDATDARVMSTLGEFAAAACQVCRSLAASKAAKEEAEKANKELLRTNAELHCADIALKLVNLDLERFASAASHDLQEPLRTVTVFTQLLSRQLQEHPEEDAGRLLKTIVDGTFRMKTLIDRLLEYSRLGQAGQVSTKVSLHDAVRAALGTLQNVIEEERATITFGELPVITGDAIQITQVLQNLILNAIRYRRKDVAPRVHISAEMRDERWAIDVRDNGEGFGMEYSEKIFEVFQRLHGSEIAGTGLGLALCRRIMERHGGTIRATSIVNQGSVFTLTVPA